MESDEDYKDRLISLIPEGAWYTAEEIGEGVGDQLDAIGEQYNCPRK